MTREGPIALGLLRAATGFGAGVGAEKASATALVLFCASSAAARNRAAPAVWNAVSLAAAPFGAAVVFCEERHQRSRTSSSLRYDDTKRAKSQRKQWQSSVWAGGSVKLQIRHRHPRARKTASGAAPLACDPGLLVAE